MNDSIKKIVTDFEADVLRELQQGGGEVELLRARDAADDRLRALKSGADAQQLEAIFSAALEIGTKLNMALVVIR